MEPGAGQAPCVWVCFTGRSVTALATPTRAGSSKGLPAPYPNLGKASPTPSQPHSVRRQTGREPQGKHPSSWSPPCANSRGQTRRCPGASEEGRGRSQGCGEWHRSHCGHMGRTVLGSWGVGQELLCSFYLPNFKAISSLLFTTWNGIRAPQCPPCLHFLPSQPALHTGRRRLLKRHI